MFINNSPWLKQLKRTRPLDRVTQDLTAGVGIIGGGIAGIVTAYYILKYTDKSVILLESNKIAHGATGHNAGQITSYFEKTFEAIFDIVSKFLVSSKAVLFGIMLYTAFNAMLFTGLAWSFHASGELRTFMVAPALYSGMLLFAGILAGVQNAWQKNPTQIQRGGGE
jgi:glycine/D-amino acid oxidase-like deaminating enzyme